MKTLIVATSAALLLTVPTVAQERGPARVSVVRPDIAVRGPVVARPDIARPRPDAHPTYPPNWREINRKLNARAKNAVENGARPAVVRKKLQAHKAKLLRRWNASH